MLALIATLPGALLSYAARQGPQSREREAVAALADRPYILLSCGISIDGYLDNASSKRLLLSNDADLERVDSVRAASDAILVGAQTVRQDNPRLLVRSQAGRDARTAEGLSRPRPRSP